MCRAPRRARSMFSWSAASERIPVDASITWRMPGSRSRKPSPGARRRDGSRRAADGVSERRSGWRGPSWSRQPRRWGGRCPETIRPRPSSPSASRCPCPPAFPSGPERCPPTSPFRRTAGVWRSRAARAATRSGSTSSLPASPGLCREPRARPARSGRPTAASSASSPAAGSGRWPWTADRPRSSATPRGRRATPGAARV